MHAAGVISRPDPEPRPAFAKEMVSHAPRRDGRLFLSSVSSEPRRSVQTTNGRSTRSPTHFRRHRQQHHWDEVRDPSIYSPHEVRFGGWKKTPARNEHRERCLPRRLWQPSGSLPISRFHSAQTADPVFGKGKRRIYRCSFFAFGDLRPLFGPRCRFCLFVSRRPSSFAVGPSSRRPSEPSVPSRRQLVPFDCTRIPSGWSCAWNLL